MGEGPIHPCPCPNTYGGDKGEDARAINPPPVAAFGPGGRARENVVSGQTKDETLPVILMSRGAMGLGRGG